MTTNESYKFFSEPLQTVILIKCLSSEEVDQYSSIIKKKVKSFKGCVQMFNYQTMVARIFLEDKDLVPTLLSDFEVEDDLQMILEDIYNGITNIYPGFILANICEDINSDLLERESFGAGLELEENVLMTRKPKTKKSKPVTLKEVNLLEKYLKSRVIGQEEAIDSLIAGYKLIASELYERSSFLFVGSTGVGKTLLATYFGKRYSGNVYRFDCNEFALEHETQKLIGSPPGYIGHNEGGVLSNLAKKSNEWVLLFDEIEEAHSKIHDTLIGLMEEGSITDNKGELLDFSKSIIIFATNAGVYDVCKNSVGFNNGDKLDNYANQHEDIRESIKRKFKAKFLNRIDNWCFFNTLTREDARSIANLELKKIPIKRTEPIISYIVDNAYSLEYGARHIKRFIKSEIAIPLADLILDRVVPRTGKLYQPSIKKGKLHIVNTRKLDDGMVEQEEFSKPALEKEAQEIRRKGRGEND